MCRILAVCLLTAATLVAATVTHDIEFVRRGGVPLRLDASIPDGAGPFPAVIIVHGGGFLRGNKVTYVPPIFQPLTQANFVWFTIDYRLVPQVALAEMVDDVLAALRWVHRNAARYKVNCKRVALLGESAGAFLVDYVAMALPEDAPVAAVVSFYGPHDLLLQAGKRGMSEGVRGLTGVGQLDDAGKDILRSLSPFFMIPKNPPPFLLLHGTADEQVPYEQSPRFCQALQARGGECELYAIPGAHHGMGQWEQHSDQLAYKAKLVDWLARKLR